MALEQLAETLSEEESQALIRAVARRRAGLAGSGGGSAPFGQSPPGGARQLQEPSAEGESAAGASAADATAAEGEGEGEEKELPE